MASNKQASKRRSKKLIWGVGTAIAAVVIAAAVTFLLTNRQKSTDDNKPASEQTSTAEAIQDTQQLKREKNYDQAAEQTSQQFQTATDSMQKYMLALQTASVYETKGDCKTAVEWYTKAYQIMPDDRGAASGLGRCYDALGDKAKAAEFYRKTIQAIDSSQPGADNDIQYYQDLLTKAEAAQ